MEAYFLGGGLFQGGAAQPGMAAASARDGASGGGSVRDDGLTAGARDGGVRGFLFGFN